VGEEVGKRERESGGMMREGDRVKKKGERRDG
jgi:hypothetical protein